MMADREAEEMHPNFARWYGEVSMDGPARKDRWSGIDEIVASVDKAYIEVLVRLAFGTKAPAGGNKEPKLAEKLAGFHAAFRNHDNTYDPGAVRESQVLAACALAQLFGSHSLAALAVTAAGTAGARKPDLPMDLFGLAENAIRTLGEVRRRRPDLSALRGQPIELSYEVDVSTLDPGQPTTVRALIEDLREAAQVAIQTIEESLDRSIKKLGRYVQVADEELQMLWWVVGERSLDLGIPFDKVTAAARPLVCGRELADRTVRLPGPTAIGALLSRAGLTSRGRVGVVAAVNALDDAWVADAVRDIEASPVTSPIHFALEKRIETGVGEAWVPGWAAISDLPPDIAAAPAVLGELFYRERLLLKLGR